MTGSSNPKAQYLTYREDILDSIRSVLESGRYVLGDEVHAFESEFANYCGAAFAVGLGNGTEALVVALKALGIGPGDEVITVSHTAVATAAAIELAGAEPVFVDIEPGYYTIDPGAIEKGLSDRTRAIIPVHLYGQSADMQAITAIARRHGLFIVEDCCQATGATLSGRKLGTFGDIGCFSFYPTKNLGAIGDGGMAITGDHALAEKMRAMREYGWNGERISEYSGRNTRLDEIQAAILRVKLPGLDADNAKRQELAAAYDGLLMDSELALPVRRPEALHAFHLYVVASDDRNATLAALNRHGIEPGIHYPVPVHRQPAYTGCRTVGSLTCTESASASVLSLPIYPELESDVLSRVAQAVS